MTASRRAGFVERVSQSIDNAMGAVLVACRNRHRVVQPA
jgi:hypothetical protein